MENLFEGYETSVAWDEMITPLGTPRESSTDLYRILRSMSPAEFEERCAERDRSFVDRGITFSLSGQERPFPLDPVPRIISAREWNEVEAGIKQRVKTLEMFLADLYGAQKVIKDGVVPRALIANSSLFRREAFDVETPNHVRIPIAGIDLIRDVNGEFRVLEDNLRTPSGVSYVIENRRAMTRIFPEFLSSHRIRPVTDFPAMLLRALRAASPRKGQSHPLVVLLSPGVYNAAYFEHSFLARQMGIELVEGRDLICRNNVVYMKTTSGEERVDVIYRRIDDDYLDPMYFRPDSALGCAGIINAARAGNVTVTSAVGNGVADDKLTYTYVPELVRYYLTEEPILKNVDTYKPEVPEELEFILDNIAELVIKPVDASGGYGLVIGPQSDRALLDATSTAILANPRGFIAQPVMSLSTSPTRVGPLLEPRHIDLRPFAINDGDSVWVLPGGLTRVALPKGSLIVNSSQGGGSKDTWVLDHDTISSYGSFPAASLYGDSGFSSLNHLPTLIGSNRGTPNDARQQQQQQQQAVEDVDPQRDASDPPC